ncbi:MAG TPA: hypothetical protein VIL29_11750 [Pseudothermotoga sp.]
MDKYLTPFLDRSKLPSRDFYSYGLIIFFVGSILGLIASIVVVAANYFMALSALRFLGLTEGMCLVSGLILIFVLIRWRSVVKELQRKMVEKFPNYATVVLKTDETLFYIGIAVAAAGLIINFFVVFGFAVIVVGLALAYHFFLKSLKSVEEEEIKFFSTTMSKTMERSIKVDLDTNTLLYSMITLFGYFMLHQEEYFSAINDYVRNRTDLLEEVKPWITNSL